MHAPDTSDFITHTKSRAHPNRALLHHREEEQYKKLMAKKIQGAKSTLAGQSGQWVWHNILEVVRRSLASSSFHRLVSWYGNSSHSGLAGHLVRLLGLRHPGG
jgi:hypothetical protein